MEFDHSPLPTDTDHSQMTQENIRFRLRNINVSRSAGPNGNHQATRNHRVNLVEAVHRLYGATVWQRYSPEGQKTATEMAIHEDGSRQNAGICRRVCPTSILRNL